MTTIYFDHNSTTKIAAEVLAKMNEAYQLPFNASAQHRLGQRASGLVELARKELKDLLNAQAYEVIFTSSSTEATNTVMFGLDVDKILISKIEHNSVYNCRPENKKIFEIETLPNGVIDLADLEKKLEEITQDTPSNFLVSTMLVQNETGAIQPIQEIATKVHQKGGLIHCDIVQAIGKIPVDLEKLNVDFASVSSHKIYGPQGVGALLVRKGLDIKPLIFGGGQERFKRAGTLNVAGIIGFGEACKLAKNNLDSFQKITNLRDLLEGSISQIGGENVKIFSQDVARIPNTSYLATKNHDNQTQLINFDLNGIYVSSGAACSSGSRRESRILKAMKVDPAFSTSAIRVSLGLDNTREEIEKFIEIWKKFNSNNN